MTRFGPNVSAAYDELRGLGYSHSGASGIVGNLLQESGTSANGVMDVRPTVSGDNGNSFGAAQWNGPRKHAYMSWARDQRVNPGDIRAQMRFLDYEMKGPEAGARSVFEAGDPEKIAVGLSDKFWRPGDPRNENRARYARLAAEGFGNRDVAQADTGTMTDAGGTDWSEMLMGASSPARVAPNGAPNSAQGAPETNWADMLMGGGPKPVAPKEEPEGEPQSFAAGMLDSVTQGITLGYGSRLTALEKATLGGTEEEGFWEEYDRFLKAEQAQQKRFGEENPVADIAGEVAGAILPAVVPGGQGAAVSGVAGRAGQLGRAMTSATPAGMAARLATGGTTRAGQIGRAVASGASAGAVYGSSEGEGVERMGNAATGALTGAAGGAAGYALGEVARKALTSIVSRPEFFVNGKLTRAGKQALRQAGIDPGEISDDFARFWAQRIKQAGGQSDEAARMAVADEFGIPLTRGQATGDVAQSAFEEAARNEARGPLAGAAVRNLDDAARARVGSAMDDMARGADDALGAAETAAEGVKARAAAGRASYQHAYKVAEETDAVIDVRAFGDLPQLARTALDEVTFNPSGQAAAALREVERLTEKATSGPTGTTGVSFQAVEQLRKKLNRVYGAADDMTKREVKAVMGALDEWTDGVMTSALIDGSDEALTAIQNARGEFAAFQRMFGRQTGDDASGIIAKMAERDVTPAEVANWLYGASKVGAKGSSVRTVKKLKTILTPEQMEAVKSGALRRVFGDGKDMGYERVASRVKDFTAGEGGALARELFTPQEIGRMRRFEQALRILTPPKEATNPSKTSYGMARLGGDMMKAMAAYIGLASGGPAGGLGAVLAAAAPGAVRNAAKAAGVAASKPQMVTRPAADAVIGGAVGATAAGIREVPQ